jgi:hypothetical protein
LFINLRHAEAQLLQLQSGSMAAALHSVTSSEEDVTQDRPMGAKKSLQKDITKVLM